MEKNDRLKVAGNEAAKQSSVRGSTLSQESKSKTYSVPNVVKDLPFYIRPVKM